MLLTNVLIPTAIKRIEAEIKAILPRIVDFIYSSQANFCITSEDKRILVLTLIPSFLARAKLTASIQMKASIKGEPVVSLARAKKLGIKVKTSILLSAEVMQKFAWEE